MFLTSRTTLFLFCGTVVVAWVVVVVVVVSAVVAVVVSGMLSDEVVVVSAAELLSVLLASVLLELSPQAVRQTKVTANAAIIAISLCFIDKTSRINITLYVT